MPDVLRDEGREGVTPRKNPPRLMLGPLTGRIYIVTRYRIIDAETGVFQALEKFDATSDFMAVKEAADERFTYTPKP